MQIFIGYDPRDAAAFDVARQSIARRLTRPIPIHALDLHDVRRRGLYRRPTEIVNGQMWDVISNAPMSSEFACSRFLVKELAQTGWALFLDSDMLVRADLAQLFALADDRYAVMCVKHEHVPEESVKQDGRAQTRYARKNWSSFMLVNCAHAANEALTVELVNSVPGRDLHRFCWLEDDDIGALDGAWNWLAGVSEPHLNPHVVHFTLGTPDMPGYEASPFAGEWWAALQAHNQEKRKAS